MPDYLIPDHLAILDSFPRTAGGKVDRKRLPDPRELTGGGDNAPPTGQVEVAIARAWSELLGLDVTDREANFFELGGHSLLAVLSDLHQLPKLTKPSQARKGSETICWQDAVGLLESPA